MLRLIILGAIILLWASSSGEAMAALGLTRAISGSWIPIASISGLGDDFPKAIEVCGEKLVVWRRDGDKQWSVMPDVCSHRHAPLSEGRVNELGCIECPYHGQSFDTRGSCVHIPQLEAGKSIPAASNIASYDVKILGDMLFALLPLPLEKNYPTPPEDLFPLLVNISSYTTRDLPYSLEFLLENFMDPAHIPYAHHSLQGTRSDGAPIPMDIRQSDASGVEVNYADSIRGKARTGVVSFKPPAYYHFRVLRAGVWKIMLFILCVPVRRGWSRIHLSLSPGAKLPLPKFLLHAMTNRFLDTDVWVHDQERVGAGFGNSFFAPMTKASRPYVMPSSSDVGVQAFRKWFAEHMQADAVLGRQAPPPQPIPKEQQLDRFATHAQYCVSCRGARTRALAVRRYTPLVALLAVAGLQKLWMRVAAVALAGAVDWVCRLVVRGVEGPERGVPTSAARIK